IDHHPFIFQTVATYISSKTVGGKWKFESHFVYEILLIVIFNPPPV
ncbi:hypothetical protein M081_3377, partial [Bacteroides fragilis str. 3998 T(B) 4]